jgi:hypothetical protein
MDYEIQLRNLLAPRVGERTRQAQALDFLRNDPFVYLPFFCRLADGESAMIREKAAKLIHSYLVQRVSLEIDLFALEQLPFRNVALAPTAVAVTQRILHDIEVSNQIPPEAAAMFLNNLSERLALAGDLKGALKYAQQAVDRFRALVREMPSVAPNFVRSLNTLVKRHAEAADQISAIQTSNEAVQLAEGLAPNP